MEQTSPIIKLGRYTLAQRIFGGVLGNRDIFVDAASTEPKLHGALTYFIFLLLNYGLTLLCVYFIAPLLFKYLFLEVIGYFFLVILLQLVLWFAFITLTHGFCKLLGGRTPIGSAHFAAVYIFPLSSFLIASLCLFSMFVYRELYYLTFIPVLLFLLIFMWRIFVLKRFVESVYGFSGGKSFAVILLSSGALGILALLVYAGINVYISNLKASVAVVGIK